MEHCNSKIWSSLNLIVLALDCLTVAFLYNKTNLLIQVSFGLCLLITIITTASSLLKQKHIIIKQLFEFKGFYWGSLIVLVAILLYTFIPECHKILSFIFMIIGDIVLITSIINAIRVKNLIK